MWLLLLLTACDGDNGGYPRNVTLAAGGETLVVKGDKQILDVEISNYNDDMSASASADPETGTPAVATCAWLTVKVSFDESEVTLTAEPNKTKQKRILYVRLSDGMANGPEIKVTQKGL